MKFCTKHDTIRTIYNFIKAIANWTNGFWPGIMWPMYDATSDEDFRESAEYGEDALDSILQNNSGCWERNVHMPAMYGDYYYVEALYKLKEFDKLFW